MNMKKTIAALAACAVATSAMATTVAAEGSVQYSLVRQTYKLTEGTVTHRAVISAKINQSAANQNYLNIIFKKAAIESIKDIKWSVNAYGVNDAGNKMDGVKFNNYTCRKETWNANFSEWINYGWGDPNYAVVSIPLDATGLNINNNGSITATGIYADVSLVVKHTDKNSWDYAPFKDAEMRYVITERSVSDLCEYGYDGLDGNIAYNGSSCTDNETYDNGEKGFEGFDYYWGLAKNLTNGIDQSVDLTESNKTEAKTELDGKFPMLTNIITNTASLTNTNVYGKQGVYNQVVGELYFADDVDKDGEKWQTLNVHGSASNILAYLSDPAMNLIEENKSYVNVVPVINDILVNYDDVTFTFNTASEAVGKMLRDRDNDNEADLVGYAYKSCKDVNDADEQYTKFNQHLYNFYGDEGTTYIYSDAYDWTNYNLFNGALIINGQLSMSLQDTNVFDYGASSLSFNWSDAVEGETVNAYATYLTKMQLATSTMWFWDNLVVSFANTEVEDVASDAGAEAEEDVIEEEVIEEEIVEEEIIEEEPVVEEPVVEEPAPAPAPAPAPNPSTGNAPIALAVVPVALAAAAVVAKKRG